MHVKIFTGLICYSSEETGIVCREFCRNWFLSKIASTLRMVRGPKYDGKYLHALLRQYLGDMKLDRALTNVVIPTFDIAFLQPTIFSSFEVTSKRVLFSCVLLARSEHSIIIY